MAAKNLNVGLGHGVFAAVTDEWLCIYVHCAPTKLMFKEINRLVKQTISEGELDGVKIIIAISGFQIDPKTGKLHKKEYKQKHGKPQKEMDFSKV